MTAHDTSDALAALLPFVLLDACCGSDLNGTVALSAYPVGVTAIEPCVVADVPLDVYVAFDAPAPDAYVALSLLGWVDDPCPDDFFADDGLPPAPVASLSLSVDPSHLPSLAKLMALLEQ